jgi:hypothetical protein
LAVPCESSVCTAASPDGPEFPPYTPGSGKGSRIYNLKVIKTQIPSKNSIKERYLKLIDDGCLCKKGGPGRTKQLRECGTCENSLFTQHAIVHWPSKSTATDASNCKAHCEEKFAYEDIR